VRHRSFACRSIATKTERDAADERETSHDRERDHDGAHVA
jgi:hypothetical protein